MSLDSLCRWQVQVSVYCAWRIPAHMRCTQCSILLHLMDICFLACICLWQISHIQTFLFKVVGPGLVSTSPAFVSSSASHPAGPHGRHAQKTVNRAPYCWGWEGSTQFAQQLAVTAPPLVGCVVWSQSVMVCNKIYKFPPPERYNRDTSTLLTEIEVKDINLHHDYDDQISDLYSVMSIIQQATSTKA